MCHNATVKFLIKAFSTWPESIDQISQSFLSLIIKYFCRMIIFITCESFSDKDKLTNDLIFLEALHTKII